MVVLGSCTAQRPSQSDSVIHVSDPSSQWRLRGFQVIESPRWRWSKQTFAVECPVPPTEKRNALKLVLRFSIPPGLEPVMLSASMNGTELRPESYRQAGSQVYLRRIPLSLLAGERAEAIFSLDHTFKPSTSDLRELGLMVESVCFE